MHTSKRSAIQKPVLGRPERGELALETRSVRRRLCGMMFGQFLVLGSWSVTFPTYLMDSPLNGGLNFPPAYTAWIYSTIAIAGVAAPIFVGLLADRLFAAEKLMGCLHLAGTFLLAFAAWWCGHQQPLIKAAFLQTASSETISGVPLLEAEERFRESADADPVRDRRLLREAFERVGRTPAVVRALDETFFPLFGLMLLYCFGNIITMILCNVIAFRNLGDPQHSFGRVRLYGTIGWIVAGISLEAFWYRFASSPLPYAAALSLLLGFYCFRLPYTPPAVEHKSLGETLGLPALGMFRDRSFCVLAGCAFLIALVQQFYSVYGNRFLHEMDVPYPAAVQTLGQFCEVGCMLSFPFVLARLGVKGTMVVGLVCWVLRNGLLASLFLPVIILALPLHGSSYAFFTVVAAMFVDRQAPAQLRASAQGILAFICSGAGPLAGNWLSAAVVQRQSTGDVVDWGRVWLTPACLAAVALLVFMLFFRDRVVRPIQAGADSSR